MNKGAQFRVKQYEYGWYIEGYIELNSNLQSAYTTDGLMCQLINILLIDYSAMLKENGAVDTANGITYFKSEEDALSVLPVIKDLYESSRIMSYLTGQYVRTRTKSFTVL